MSILEISTISSKGQIVIPNNIRKELKISEGTKFAIITDGENLLLKKIEAPKIKEFKKLISNSKKAIKNKDIKKSDLEKIITDTRKNASHS